MPQVSVIPAKTRPAPTKAASPRKAGCTNAPRAVPTTTSDPAAMRTWRSSEITFGPRTTGSPACSQASVPPSTQTTFSYPAAMNRSAACRLRLPGSADQVQRFVRTTVAALHDRPRIERSAAEPTERNRREPPEIRRECERRSDRPAVPRAESIPVPSAVIVFGLIVLSLIGPSLATKACYNISSFQINYIPDWLTSQAMANAIPDEVLELMAEKFRMLADSTRLAILAIAHARGA